MSVIHEKDAYSEYRFYYVDSNIAEVFTIPFVRGNPKTALNRPNTVVITDDLPDEVSFEGASPECTHDLSPFGGTVTCTIGTMEPGEIVDLLC